MKDVLYWEVAGFYEALYRKNLLRAGGIGRECDVIEEILLRNASAVSSIIDAGCGTGVHSAELASRNYEVLAFDYSQKMVDLARRKAAAPGNGLVTFVQGDMRRFVAAKKHDALICMTNAFLCNHSDSQVRMALACFAQSLRSGGVLLIEASDYLRAFKSGAFDGAYLDCTEVDGREVVEVSENELDLRNNVLVERNTYFLPGAGGDYSVHESENRLRLLDAKLLARQMRGLGFVPTELLDAETLKPAGDNTVEHFIVARRA